MDTPIATPIATPIDSILTSIKKLLGLAEDDTSFDTDIIININTAIMSLTQLGVGPSEGYSITDKTDEWADFLGDRTDLAAVKTYIYFKVKLAFDPPQTGPLIDSYKNQIAELEFRINVQAEGGES